MDFNKMRDKAITNESGIFAEIYEKGVPKSKKPICFREGKNMQIVMNHHVNWAQKHKHGTHTKKTEVNRKGEIVTFAKKFGAKGFRHVLISNSPKLVNNAKLRNACKKYLYNKWLKNNPNYRKLKRGYSR